VDLAIERLPEHLTVRVREERERVRTEQEERTTQERAAEQADPELDDRLAEIAVQTDATATDEDKAVAEEA
jgi:hypothetical protein